MDYTIVDTEIPSNNPWPKGVVKIDGKHRVSWAMRRNASTLWNTISCDIEMAPDQPMLNAYAAFAQIVKTRRDWAKAQIGIQGIFIEDITAEENLFNRHCSFSCSYRICHELTKLLTDSGLWRPLNLNTWGEWAFSIANVSDQRGYANSQHLASNDVIIDPCGTSFSIPWDAIAVEKPQQNVQMAYLLKNEMPDAIYSWLDFENHIAVKRSRAPVRQMILQQPTPEPPDETLISTGGMYYPPSAATPDILQKNGKPKYSAVLYGHARRVGYPIPQPSLTSVGNSAATQVEGNSTFECALQGNHLGVPVYAARWMITYNLAGEPGAVLPQPNYPEGIASDGTTQQPTGP
jgi:hypothetical protein